MSNDPLALVRQRELAEIVAALDRALGAFERRELLADRAGDAVVAVPLDAGLHVERALRRAADYLADLRYDGRIQ